MSGGARVQPRGWASVPGRLGSLGASSRAGGFGECPEGADAAAEAPLHREGSASRVGTEAASGGVGVQAPPPAQPGPARPGPVRRAPGVFERAGAAKGTWLSRFAGILSAALSRQPRLASLTLRREREESAQRGLGGQRAGGPESLGKGLTLVSAVLNLSLSSDQFSSVAQSCPTLRPLMPSNHLLLCRPLLLLPSVFASIRVFSSESVLHIRWPKYCSFSFINQSFQ